MVRKNITTIQVYPQTRDALKNLGDKGETYDMVIKKLIKSYRESPDA